MTAPSLRVAAALSVLVHIAIASLVLWRGAVWFKSSGGDVQRGDRSATTWVALPPISSPQAETPSTPLPRAVVSSVVPSRIEPVKLHLPVPLRATIPGTSPEPVGDDEAMGVASDRGPSCGGGREVGAIPVADADWASGDSARDIFGPTPLPMPPTTAEAPPDDRGPHEVQFWIRADGRVTRIAVRPPIRDSEYRHRFREAMSTFVFGPVKTPDGHPIDYVYNCVVSP